MSGPADAGIVLFNPLPWGREVAGPVPTHVLEPRGVADDPTAARHFQDRGRRRPPLPTQSGVDRRPDPYGSSVVLEPTHVPGYGYVTVGRDRVHSQSAVTSSTRDAIETHRYDVRFDLDRGGIDSLYDVDLDHEWVNGGPDVSLGGFVHERVRCDEGEPPRQELFEWPADEWDAAAGGLSSTDPGFRTDWESHRSLPERVERHVVYDTPLGYDVRQELVVPALESDVSLRMLFPSWSDEVVVEADWRMGLQTAPEATYLTFPLSLSDPVARVDVGGTGIEVGAEQLPGAPADHHTVQKWAALSDVDRGMVVGCPLNPMVQFGEFDFGNLGHPGSFERPQVVGWVTNNFWDTNFRAHQPGPVRARYHLSPHTGPFDESAAHRRGAEAECWAPLAQTLAEEPVVSPPFGSSGRLLELPKPPTLVLHIRPAGGQPAGTWPPYTTVERSDEFDVFVLFRNASDDRRRASIGSAELTISDAARKTPLGGPTEGTVTLADGRVTVDLTARETAGVALACTW